MCSYLRVVEGGVVLHTDDPETAADYAVGDLVVVADCGGFAPAGARFKHACTCGHDCSAGSTPTLVGVEPLPDVVRQAAQKLAVAEAATAKARRRYRRAEESLRNAVRSAGGEA